MKVIEFNSARLAFRCWEDRHKEQFGLLNKDPEVMRYFPSTLTQEQSDAIIARWQAEMKERGFSIWAVELRETGELAGAIGLSVPRFQFPFMPCVEIGWRLKREFWGMGYATEGAKECLRIGFGDLMLNEIVSFTALPNQPSKAVMERIGMRNSGEDFDHPALPEGHVLRRHCLYRILKEDWDRHQ